MSARAQRDPNVVVRRIYFYKIDVGRDQDSGRPLAFDAPASLRPLGGLRFDDESAYMIEDDTVTCGWLDREPWPSRLRIADIRRTNLPQVEQLGELTPLIIDRRAGLAEQIHVAFYPNNVVGSEFNFYGPRIARVAKFLRNRVGMAPVSFEYLYRGDVIAQLNQLRDIRLFQLRISPPFIDELSTLDDSVAAMFRAADALGEIGRVEVILRPIPYSRQPLPQRVRAAIGALVGRSVTRDAADVFRTEGLGPDGRVHPLDLLKDELVAEREMRRRSDGSRALDSSSVYSAIDDAYDQLRPELERAHGASES